MADTKISALAAVSSVVGADEIVVIEAGTSKKASLTQVASFIGAGGQIINRDNFVSSGGTTYTASNAPAISGTLYVAVNGAICDTATCTISGLTLTTPAYIAGTSIAWAYYTSLPPSASHLIETLTSSGTTDFPLTHNPTAIEIVALSGLIQNTTAWSLIAPNIVRFVGAPITGASVTTSYLY